MSKINLEILAYDESPLGVLCLRRRELVSQPGTIVTEVTLNHEFLMSSLYTDSERELARVAIEMHGGSDLRVLVGGLGLGYTAKAALNLPQTDSVEVVELLPQVIDWLKNGLVPLSSELQAESRLSIVLDDVYERMMRAPSDKLYDVIMIDVDHSPDDRLGNENSKFYESEGLRSAKRHLNPDGVLAVWSYAESSPFADALRSTFQDVRVEPVTYDNQLVHEHCTDWLFFARG